MPLSRTLDWGDMRVPGFPGRGSFFRNQARTSVPEKCEAKIPLQFP